MSESPLGVEIDDPDNYSSSERLKHIYDARRQLREMRTKAATHRKVAPQRAVAYYRTAAEGYLMELDTLMRNHPPGPSLLYEKDFGTVTIHPPGEWQQRHGYWVEKTLGQNNKNLKVTSPPKPKEVQLKGLSSLIEMSSPIKRDFEISQMHELTGDSSVRLTATGHIGWETLNRMVAAMNDFVSELGLGLDVDEQDEWKI